MLGEPVFYSLTHVLICDWLAASNAFKSNHFIVAICAKRPILEVPSSSVTEEDSGTKNV